MLLISHIHSGFIFTSWIWHVFLCQSTAFCTITYFIPMKVLTCCDQLSCLCSLVQAEELEFLNLLLRGIYTLHKTAQWLCSTSSYFFPHLPLPGLDAVFQWCSRVETSPVTLLFLMAGCFHSMCLPVLNPVLPREQKSFQTFVKVQRDWSHLFTRFNTNWMATALFCS